MVSPPERRTELAIVSGAQLEAGNPGEASGVGGVVGCLCSAAQRDELRPRLPRHLHELGDGAGRVDVEAPLDLVGRRVTGQRRQRHSHRRRIERGFAHRAAGHLQLERQT